jgi:hypothetical protein
MKISKKISEKRIKQLDEMCSSWMTFAPHVGKLNRDECIYIMIKELTERDKPRPEFIARPFARAVRMNRENLWHELQGLAPGCGYRVRNKEVVRA